MSYCNGAVLCCLILNRSENGLRGGQDYDSIQDKNALSIHPCEKMQGILQEAVGLRKEREWRGMGNEWK